MADAERTVTVRVGTDTREIPKGMRVMKKELRDAEKTVNKTRGSFGKLGDELERIEKLRAKNLLSAGQAFAARTQAIGAAAQGALPGRLGSLAATALSPAGFAAMIGTAVAGAIAVNVRRDQGRVQTSLTAGIPFADQERLDRMQRQNRKFLSESTANQMRDAIGQIMRNRPGTTFDEAREAFVRESGPAATADLVRRSMGRDVRAGVRLLSDLPPNDPLHGTGGSRQVFGESLNTGMGMVGEATDRMTTAVLDALIKFYEVSSGSGQKMPPGVATPFQHHFGIR